MTRQSVGRFLSVYIKALIWRGMPVVVWPVPSPRVESIVATWVQHRCAIENPVYDCVGGDVCSLLPANSGRRYRVYYGGPLAWSGGSRGRVRPLSGRYCPRLVKGPSGSYDELDMLGVRRDVLGEKQAVVDQGSTDRRLQVILAHEMAHERQQFCPVVPPVERLTILAAEREAEQEQREYCRDVLDSPWGLRQHLACRLRLVLHRLVSLVPGASHMAVVSAFGFSAWIGSIVLLILLIRAFRSGAVHGASSTVLHTLSVALAAFVFFAYLCKPAQEAWNVCRAMKVPHVE